MLTLPAAAPAISKPMQGATRTNVDDHFITRRPASIMRELTNFMARVEAIFKKEKHVLSDAQGLKLAYPAKVAAKPYSLEYKVFKF